MRTPPRIALTAALAAVTLASAVGTAAAEDLKPPSRPAPAATAPDDSIAAAAERVDREGTALGSYWDGERGELVVVVGPDSDIDKESVQKLVDGPARLEQRDIAKKT